MNDAFDTAFNKTCFWIRTGSEENKRPAPDMTLSELDRTDWWRGYDKAFTFCAEIQKLEEAKIAMIEDLCIKALYVVLIVGSLFMINSFSLLALPGSVALLYFMKRLVTR